MQADPGMAVTVHFQPLGEKSLLAHRKEGEETEAQSRHIMLFVLKNIFDCRLIPNVFYDVTLDAHERVSIP